MYSWVLNTVGLGMAFLGAGFLVRFGITFRGDDAGVFKGKHWTKLGLTMELGQRLGFTMLAIGFILQFIAQFS
jgi:hypothetical protein